MTSVGNCREADELLEEGTGKLCDDVVAVWKLLSACSLSS